MRLITAMSLCSCICVALGGFWRRAEVQMCLAAASTSALGSTIRRAWPPLASALRAQGVAYRWYVLPPTLDPLRGQGTLRLAPSSHTWTQTRRCPVPWLALFWPTVHPSIRCSHPVRVSMYGFVTLALPGVRAGVSPACSPVTTNAARDAAIRAGATRRRANRRTVTG